MNHIYKVIWSRVKNSYVVVSEIAGTAKKSAAFFVKPQRIFIFYKLIFAVAVGGGYSSSPLARRSSSSVT